jgi:hypothetical protein
VTCTAVELLPQPANAAARNIAAPNLIRLIFFPPKLQHDSQHGQGDGLHSVRPFFFASTLEGAAHRETENMFRFE